ncbi:hypothetical protein E3N88_07729 [Mikania micrantha]|uniref:Non-specific lipid-transfer protein n=1 Tax=Mikania micrantha TaxID=192012 RepID=A0A5N6PEB1_9ASTR|nr:hypothetical protein E3N88_07729 [Mikania micrantha]
MARMATMVLCAVVTCMVVVAPHAEASMSCGLVARNLAQCAPYLTGEGNAPTNACCDGVRALNEAANTTPDRQTACNCLQSAYSSSSGIEPSNAASLASQCGVNIPYEISPNTDCSKVH